MAKTQEELTQLKTEYEALSTKLQELSEDELNMVTGGAEIWDIGVKLKEKFNVSLLGSRQGDGVSSSINTHGKNGRPTLPLWDEASSGLIIEPKDSQ